MGVFADIFNLVWRDGSGTPHSPLKNEIRSIGETLDVALQAQTDALNDLGAATLVALEARDDLIASVNAKLETSVVLTTAALLVGADAPLGPEYTADPDGRVTEYTDTAGMQQVSGGAGFGRALSSATEKTPYASNYAGDGAGNFVASSVYLRTDSVLLCIPFFGQSLSEGFNGNATGDDAFTTTAPYPDNAFMPSVGAYLRGSGARFSSLVALKESDPFPFIHETQATSFAQHLLADLQTLAGRMPRLLTFNASVGGNTWQQLMPGSLAWTLLMNAVADSVAIAVAQKRRLVVPAIICNIGESNLNVSKTQSAAFTAMLRNASRQLNRDIKAITGQTEDVVMMVWGIIYSDNGQYGENHIFDAFSRLDDPLIRVIGPHYAMPMSDEIHHDSMGYYRMGKVAARAVRDEIFGPGFSPLRLVSSGWLSSTKFRLTFNVPVAPLVLDISGADVSVPLAGTTNGWAGSRYGFEADDGSGNAIDLSAATFAVVTPSGGYPAVSIDVTLGSAPTAKDVWISYAWHADGDNPGESGPLVGPRGCLRDSASIVSIEDGHVDRNWCLPFRARIGERLI